MSAGAANLPSNERRAIQAPLNQFLAAFDKGRFDTARDRLAPLAVSFSTASDFRLRAFRLRLGMAEIQGHYDEADLALDAAGSAEDKGALAAWAFAIFRTENAYERFFRSLDSAMIAKAIASCRAALFLAEETGRSGDAAKTRQILADMLETQRDGHPDIPLGGPFGLP